MAVKKSELYSSLWRSCDELRGGMDASQYKDYVLALLFVKYVSDKYGKDSNALIMVPRGGNFADMIKLKGNKDIGDKMNKILRKLADENGLHGLFTVDFNDEAKLGTGKEMQDRLSNLIAIFESPELDFSNNGPEGDDLLGDAYEYLMRHFATESGKSKGQFYTPAEVSRIMAKVIGLGQATSVSQTIYDPTCGSGSLLIKAHDEALPLDLAMYGQEMDVSTTSLAKMNMIMHNCPAAVHDILQGNTLSTPKHLDESGNLKTFDFVVANPPFSNKAWRNGFDPENDLFGRFEYGIPPAKNGDYAFLLHLLRSMKSTGKGAIILPHGVLFRGNVEAEIRKEIVRRGFVKGIIGLPANLFYGTGIPACIIVLDKEDAAKRKGIFIIDASKGFMKDGSKNRLREQDIHKIVDVFNNQIETPRYSRCVSMDEIAANDYNLNIPRYIDSSEPEDLHDIEAHLRGGIPNRDIDELAPYWAVFPSLRQDLFVPSDRPGYSSLRLPMEHVRETILSHPEFLSYTESVRVAFAGWAAAHQAILESIDQSSRPKAFIELIAEEILLVFGSVPLLDQYDVYQRLMDYWAETMQDDVYLVAADGWLKASRPHLLPTKSKEKADLVVGRDKYTTELIPPALVIERYFKVEQTKIDELEATAERLASDLEALREEHGGEDGLLAEVQNERGNVTKGAITARLKEIAIDPDYEEERELLADYLALLDQEAETKKAAKGAQAKLMKKLLAKYKGLKEAEVKQLVVADKWLAAITAGIQAEVERLSQEIAGRVRQLAERYAKPLSQLNAEVEVLEAKVAGHLERMGFEWRSI